MHQNESSNAVPRSMRENAIPLLNHTVQDMDDDSGPSELELKQQISNFDLEPNDMSKASEMPTFRSLLK